MCDFFVVLNQNILDIINEIYTNQYRQRVKDYKMAHPKAKQMELIFDNNIFVTSDSMISNYNGIFKYEPFKYEFNPFSEYLLIDLYTPDGLNYKDTYGDKIYFRQDLDVMTRSGVRIYHCDGRIFKCRVYYGDSGTKLVYDKDNPEWDGSYLESNEAVLMTSFHERWTSRSSSSSTAE